MRLRDKFYYYNFFIAFPVILIVQNISVYIFIFLVQEYISRNNILLRKINFVEIFALLLGVGATLSVIFSLGSEVPGSFSRGLVVLPNYLYWVFLIIFYSSYAKFFNYQLLFKAIFWGLIGSTVYFYIFNDTLRHLLLFKHLQQNFYSFLLICFSPIFIYYVEQRWGRGWAVLSAILIVLSGFLSGSRSGSILTIFTGLLTLYSKRINIVSILFFVIIIAVTPLILSNNAVKSLIFNLNERTYDLLYNQEETLTTDQSYLVRVAQVEKGVALFQEHPLFGVGLNNFSKNSYTFEGDFEGSERALKIENLDELSAHNSYVSLLAEGGLAVFLPFTLLVLSLLIYYLRNFRRIPDFQKPFLWGMMGMLVHLYFISAIVNVFGWLLIACVATTVRYNSRNPV